MARLTTRQKVPYTIDIKKADGTPGAVQNLVAASSDETVLRVVPADAGGLTGFVESVAPSSVANRITWTGNADLGTGEVHNLIVISEDVTVDLDPRDEASVMSVSLGAAVDKTAAVA